MLRPDEAVQRVLISTTSKIVGEYESGLSFVTPAHTTFTPYKYYLGDTEGAFCRNYFYISFRTEVQERQAGMIVTNYNYIGEWMCILLSIVFGKRFDLNGVVQNSGSLYIPENEHFPPISYSYIGSNNHQPRKDLEIKLSFENFKIIEQIILSVGDEINIDLFNILITAGKFYLRAIQIHEAQPEIAFLDLITCGEVLSSHYKFSDDEIYDDTLKGIFEKLSKVENGGKILKQIKKRLFQVKRQFTLTILKLLNDYFFTNTESKNIHGSLKKEDIDLRLKSAYDLRSQYVHTGVRFGHWLQPRKRDMPEVWFGGSPITGSKDLSKLIEKSPTFIGLERIMRYCLIRFIHVNMIKIDERLDD